MGIKNKDGNLKRVPKSTRESKAKAAKERAIKLKRSASLPAPSSSRSRGLKRAYTIDPFVSDRLLKKLEKEIDKGRKPFFKVLNVVTNGRADEEPDVYDKYLKELKEELERLDKKIKSDGPLDLTQLTAIRHANVDRKAIAAAVAKGSINTLLTMIATAVAAKYNLGAGAVKMAKSVVVPTLQVAAAVTDISPYYEIYKSAANAIFPHLSELALIYIFYFKIGKFLPAAGKLTKDQIEEFYRDSLDKYKRHQQSVGVQELKSQVSSVMGSISRVPGDFFQKIYADIQCDIINAIYKALIDPKIKDRVFTEDVGKLSLLIANSMQQSFNIQGVMDKSLLGKAVHTVADLHMKFRDYSNKFNEMIEDFKGQSMSLEKLNTINFMQLLQERKGMLRHRRQFAVIIKKANELMEIIFGTTDYDKLKSYLQHLNEDCLKNLAHILGFNPDDLMGGEMPTREDYMTYIDVVIKSDPISRVSRQRHAMQDRSHSPGPAPAERRSSRSRSGSRSDRSSRDRSSGGSASRRKSSRKQRKTIRKKVSKSMKRTFKKTKRQRK